MSDPGQLSVRGEGDALANVLGVLVFVALFWLTWRRGETDPSCGMKVDRAKAVRRDFAGETFYFCSEHCLHAFEVSAQERAPAGGSAKAS